MHRLEMQIKTNWLRWPVEKSSQTFRTFVVEPLEFQPDLHAKIFDAALMKLLSNGSHDLVSGAQLPLYKERSSFDLVTFPEAFLAAEELIKCLHKVAFIPKIGCIHVGLRPSARGDHLFKQAEVQTLLDGLKAIPGVVKSDLDGLDEWIVGESVSSYFNLACVFTRDANGAIRVCIHPKVVRAKVEFSPLCSKHMTEAGLLSLITLEPVNPLFNSITVQPVICSDVLPLSTDLKHIHPLSSLGSGSSALSQRVPDHVDVVSMTVFTPVQNCGEEYGTTRRFHSVFRAAFAQSATHRDYFRHHTATYVMANFGKSPGGAKTWGLSGVFMPCSLEVPHVHPYLSYQVYGMRSEEHDPEWHHPQHLGKGKAHMASLNMPQPTAHAALIMGFTISRLVREVPRWGPSSYTGLSEFELINIEFDNDTNF